MRPFPQERREGLRRDGPLEQVSLPGIAADLLQNIEFFGFFDALQATPRNGVIQLVTPDELRGRVSSFQNMLVSGVPGLGQTLIGGVASIAGAPLAVAGGAVLCAATVLGIAVARPDLRAPDLESPEPAVRAREPEAAATR